MKDLQQWLAARQQELDQPIDAAKALALVQRLRASLKVREIEGYDPLYGLPCPWYPSGVLVDAEKLVACGVGEPKGEGKPKTELPSRS